LAKNNKPFDLTTIGDEGRILLTKKLCVNYKPTFKKKKNMHIQQKTEEKRLATVWSLVGRIEMTSYHFSPLGGRHNFCFCFIFSVVLF